MARKRRLAVSILLGLAPVPELQAEAVAADPVPACPARTVSVAAYPPPSPGGPPLQPVAPATAADAAAPAAEEEEKLDPSVRPLQFFKEQLTQNLCGYECFWKHLEIDGYLDQTYVYNFNKPRDGVNSLRPFDRKHNVWMINNALIHIRKESTEESRWGFGTKLMAGMDANVVSPYLMDNTDDVDVLEAYATYLLPTSIGQGLLIKAGRFATLAGAEVIEQKDNMNISRSFLFGYAVPFTHTGVRGTWNLSDDSSVSFGVNKGWDSFNQDQNDKLTLEAGFSHKVNDKLTLLGSLYHGDEQVEVNDRTRTLLDLVALYEFSDTLTGAANVDIGYDEDAATDGRDANWAGIAGYLKKDINDRLSVAARAEVFSDNGGSRTGTDQTLWEATLTGQYKIRENMFWRVEARHDESNRNNVFNSDDADGFSGSQNTIATSVLITF